MWWRIFLKEFPYFHRKIKVNETDKMKRREAIIYKIVKHIPSDIDKWYVQFDRDSDTYYIGKEGEIRNYCYRQYSRWRK